MAAALEVGCIFKEYEDAGEMWWRPPSFRSPVSDVDNAQCAQDVLDDVVKALKFTTIVEYLNTCGGNPDEVRRRLMTIPLPEEH